VDALATATPLGVAKEAFKSGLPLPFEWNHTILMRMFVGDINGSIGETSALALLIGGLYLLYRRVITWHIPVSYIGVVAVYAAILHIASPAQSLPIPVHLLSGGLLLGAFFMATDMVTTPVTRRGLLIFGAGCGLLTMILRTVVSGSYPEGVSFAILIMNAFTPLINRATRPRRFGARKA
jgi:electron transport complex protein RnfD